MLIMGRRGGSPGRETRTTPRIGSLRSAHKRTPTLVFSLAIRWDSKPKYRQIFEQYERLRRPYSCSGRSGLQPPVRWSLDLALGVLFQLRGAEGKSRCFDQIVLTLGLMFDDSSNFIWSHSSQCTVLFLKQHVTLFLQCGPFL